MRMMGTTLAPERSPCRYCGGSSPRGFDDVIVRVRVGSGALREGPKIRPFVRMPHDHSHRARSDLQESPIPV
jgi:hypothetical protein